MNGSLYCKKKPVCIDSLVEAVDLIDELMSTDGKHLKTTLNNFINESKCPQIFAITVYLKR